MLLFSSVCFILILIRINFLLMYLLQSMAEEEPEKFQAHFSEYLKKGIDADGMESLYKKVHAAIRADPTMAKSTKKEPATHKRYIKLADDFRKDYL